MRQESLMSVNIIRWESGADGIVVLTMDDPNQSANTLNADYVSSMAATVDRLESERDSVIGVILTSAKKTFFAGADLNELLALTKEQAAEFFAKAEKIKADLRRLERLGKPVVAAINGAALGGGLEIALACHHRVAADVKGLVLGTPELNLGLVNEVVDTVDELVPRAKEWIKANPEAVQPWDVKGFKIPGGSPTNPS